MITVSSRTNILRAMEVMTGNGPFLLIVYLNKCVVSEGYMKPQSFVCCSLSFFLLILLFFY